MDKDGEIPWSCLAPGRAWKARIWHTSDGTTVLAWHLAAASPNAINSGSPLAQVQTCIVHLIRHSIGFASWKERTPLPRR